LSFKFTRIPQTYVTTVSLVLVTAFRAALIACISSCYTQYLWKELRSQLLKVSLIEELFRIRSNPFRLLNQYLVRNTPILVLVAGISWLIPVATVYPPGALIVSMDTRILENVINISVFQPNKTYLLKDDVEDTYTNGLALVENEIAGLNETLQDMCGVISDCRYR
jgi:hypothetical protein